ncbi:MAG: MFS transporter, partial [Clostridia bacterium]|nr:MFS transporter [Clostridia bacterium]
IVSAVISIFTVKKYDAEIENIKQKNIVKEIWSVLKTPFMKFLIVPNFLRGIGSGILGMSAVIMIAQLGASESISSLLSVAMAISVVIGCIIFGQIYRKIRVVKCVLFGGLVGTVSLCLMIANKNPLVFVIMYSLTWLFFTFVDYGIPVYVTQIVGYEHMGTYSAIRMLTHMSGTTVATYISGKMIDNNSFLLLLLGGACITISVVSYYLFDKVLRKRGFGA